MQILRKSFVAGCIGTSKCSNGTIRECVGLGADHAGFLKSQQKVQP